MRVFWFVLGCLALILGGLGVVLPILPTTPFVILAAFAFGKSSRLLEVWLKNNRVFGPMIEDWRSNGAIAPQYKAIAIVMMAAAFGLSIWQGLAPLVIGIQAVAISAAGAFILTRPSGRA